MKRRPLGVGIINFAFWLAKNDTNYSRTNLELVDEYAEAWSYYLIKASADSAEEKGTGNNETKYGMGITPLQHIKLKDELLTPRKIRLERFKKTITKNRNKKQYFDGINAAETFNDK